MKTVVTGASGFIGRALIGNLGQATILSRDPDRANRILSPNHVRGWAPDREPAPPDAISGADVVFHLAGEPVATRWTSSAKTQIRESRVVGTRNLIAGIAAANPRPKVLVSASAVGFYGNRGDEILDERSAAESDFLAEVCQQWEREAAEATRLGVRVVSLRIGIVLGREGGALARMLPPFRLGIGGRLGDGRQWMPWIHLDDLVGLFLFAAQNDSVSGPVNAVAPNGVTNAEFTRALATALHRPAIFPVPPFALRLAFGEMSGMLLGSQRVIPRRALEAGYSFRFPSLAPALESIVGGPSN